MEIRIIPLDVPGLGTVHYHCRVYTGHQRGVEALRDVTPRLPDGTELKGEDRDAALKYWREHPELR